MVSSDLLVGCSYGIHVISISPNRERCRGCIVEVERGCVDNCCNDVIYPQSTLNRSVLCPDFIWKN